MKKLMVTVLLFQALFLTGQQGFNKTYGFEQEQIIGSSFTNVLLDRDTLVLFGTCYPSVTPSGQQALLFVKMDTLGNVLLQKWHLDPDAPMDEYAANPNLDIIKTSDNGYALTGVALSTNFGVFVKLSNEGEIEFYKKYDPSPGLQYQPRKILELEASFLLSGHKTQENGDSQIFLMKVSKQGDIIWEKTYGIRGVNELMGSMIKINANHFAIGGGKYIHPGSPPYNSSNIWVKSWLIEVDSIGNILRSNNESNLNEQNGIVGLNKVADGWIYGTGEFKLFNQFEWGVTSKVVRTGEDINDVIWEQDVSTTTLAGNSMVDVKPTPEGKWIAVGKWASPPPPPPSSEPNYLGGSTFKFSSEGKRLWARLDTAIWHPECGSSNRFSGVVVLPSGSIVAAGTANSYCFNIERSFGWVIKISKDGCIDTLCVTTDVHSKLNQAEIIVYPNPTSGIMNIKGCENCEAEVYDLFGRLVLKQHDSNQSLDLSLLMDGAYILIIKRGGMVLKIDKVIKGQ